MPIRRKKGRSGSARILGYLRGLHAPIARRPAQDLDSSRVIIWRWQFIIVALASAATLPWVSAASVMWSNRFSVCRSLAAQNWHFPTVVS